MDVWVKKSKQQGKRKYGITNCDICRNDIEYECTVRLCPDCYSCCGNCCLMYLEKRYCYCCPPLKVNKWKCISCIENK